MGLTGYNQLLISPLSVQLLVFSLPWINLPNICFPIIYLKYKFQEQGAATTTYLATAPEVTKGGDYYESCHATPATSYARNPESAKKLWELSEKMIEEYQRARGPAQTTDQQ